MTTSTDLRSPRWAQVPDGPAPRRPSVLAVWVLAVAPLAVALAQEMMQPPTMVPEGWQFP